MGFREYFSRNETHKSKTKTINNSTSKIYENARKARARKEVEKVEKIGIIDLGSNTARLVIVDMFADGHFMVVDELKESVRLGQDMDRDGFLKPQRIAETVKTLKMFKK